MSDPHDDDLINKAAIDFKAKLRLHDEYDPEPEPTNDYVPPRPPLKRDDDPVRKLLSVYPNESVVIKGTDGHVYAIWNDGGRGRGNKRGHVFKPYLTREERKTVRLFSVEVNFPVRYVL